MSLEKVFDKNFQDNVVCALIMDDEFLSYAQAILPVDSFLSPISRKLVESIYQFYTNYGTAPKDHFQSYFSQLIQAGAFTEGDGEICRNYLTEISTLSPNPRYLLETVSTWRRRQSIKGALLQAAPLIENGSSADLTKAQQLFDHAFQQGVESVELGKELFEVTNIPFSRFTPDLKFEIKALDRAIKGMKRNELIAIHGSPGIGKSWFMTHLLRALALQGEPGIIYTGEMEEWDVIGRAVQNFGGLTTTKLKQTRIWNPATKSFQVTENPKSIWDVYETRKAIENAAGFGSRIIVKEFLPNEFGVADIDAHISMVERIKGFVPTAILVDYDELLASSIHFDQTRLALLDIFNGLKGLAKKWHIIVILATQSNVQGIDAKVMGMKHLGESFAKAKPTDVMISLNQTSEEYLAGIMRLFVYKNRNGPRYQTIKIWQNFEIGQFCLHSERVKKEVQPDGQ